MKHYRFLLPAALALLLLPAACSAPRAARDLPPTWVWERDQDRIHPDDGTLNVWEGFTVKPGRFAAGPRPRPEYNDGGDITCRSCPRFSRSARNPDRRRNGAVRA